MNVPWEAAITVVLYLIGSTLGFVWWMATQTIKLEIAITNLEEIKKTLSKSEATYATKVDVAKDVSNIFKEIDALWKKYDHSKGE